MKPTCVRLSLLAMLALPAMAQVEDAVPRPPVPGIAVVNPFQPFDRARFESMAAKLGASKEQLAAFATKVDELGLSRAADDLLRAVAPKFDAAVKLHEEGDPRAALELMQLLAATADPLLQAHVRYHLARLFLDDDDPENAIQVLNDYLSQNLNLSPLDAEAAFFYAQALAEVPMLEHALPRYQAFLAWFPDASERFRSAAMQRITEIERQQQSRLHQLADGMKRTTRDLRKQKTDKPVQVDQEGYVEELQELIEMFEEMEKQAGGAASGLGKSNSPATSPSLPGGESSVGQLNKRPSLAARWGDMKDKDREKIKVAVQNGLPPQYRKQLENYYKKLGGAAEK